MTIPTVDLTYLAPLITPEHLAEFQEPLHEAQVTLLQKTGLGAEYLGWLHLPQRVTPEEIALLEERAKQVRESSQILLVVGIGGSYLGSRAALEYLQSPFYNYWQNPQVFFVGNNLSPSYLHQVLAIVGDRDFAVNVVSKSGTTTEPAISFHILRQLLEKRYGVEGARKRIYATTDPASGTLRAMAEEKGYATFAIPPDVGGRYSVLTSCGLFPLTVAGIDATALLRGGAIMADKLHKEAKLEQNPAWSYVAARHALYNQGRIVEHFGSYQPNTKMLAEWWRQLFGESEGKEGKGILPSVLEFTADLHSMGQYIQEGPRNLFTTILDVENPGDDELLHVLPDDPLYHLNGWSMNVINAAVQKAAAKAHQQGEAPSIIIRTPYVSPVELGALLYFFQYACALSGYLLGVNPFDQPGVEAYKAELKQLLQRK
ncbi:MAG: glucose-6-phosphate isomerase [Symbiobacteriaceae bacterium]|nr:glucose-6-phosphate isomerase [Symbiobacteriaceae bacterium]